MANFNVKSLLEAKNPQAIMLEQTRGLKGKWEKTGLLEGLKDRDQHSMAVLLENQAQQLLTEASQTGANGQGSEEWSGVALPLVRRIFGEIAAKEFVSVQPMNLPSGLIFFMDFKYGTTADGKTAGQSLYGGSGAKFGRTDAATGGLYGNGTFGYSMPSMSIVTSVPATVTSASWADAGFRQEYSASIAGANSQLRKVVIPVTSISGSDVEAVKSFILSGAFASNLNEFATHDYAASNYTFIISASAAFTSIGSIKYNTQPSSYARGDFEDQTPINNGAGALGGTGVNLNIPEVDLELKSESIVAKTRKLKAVWTPELAQDLNAYHSIDAEAELTSMLSEYISLEIDLEILDMLQVNALTVDYWSATVGEEYNSVTGVWAGGNSSLAYQKSTWFQTLGVKLNKVSNKIHQLTMRGGANFIVASPDVCTILESIPGFHVNAEKDAMQFAAGVSVVGSISNRYTVYKNPYMTSNQILLGYKGSNFLETGAVYAPYVPLIMTPLVYDPDNFTPRRGVMTRYAKKIVRPEFYGRIFVKDLNLI
jgi:Major capsid protein Gp23